MKIAIINYEVGNIKSLSNALEKLNLKVIVTNNKDEILSSDFVILPGVGAFEAAMNKLKEYQLDHVIKEYVASGRPILGICIGMHVLFDKGFEMGTHNGLGLISGTVEKIPTNAKLPHMGWNNLIMNKDVSYLKDFSSDEYVYFVHSYYCNTSFDNVVSYTEYGGIKIPALMQVGNIYGTQFHPEKSGKAGLKLLKDILVNIGGIE